MKEAIKMEKCGYWEMEAEAGQESEIGKSNLGKTGRTRSKRIILVSPPIEKSQKYLYRLGASIGLGYLASFLDNNGHHVDILEPSLENQSIDDVSNIISRNDYDLVGFSIPSGGMYKNISRVIRMLKKEGFEGHITLGGHFPTFEHREILKYNDNIDSIVRNEGEITLLELVNSLDEESFENIDGISFKLSNEVHINPPRPCIKNLDILPFPRRDIFLRTNSKIFSMITSRGCSCNCSFCSVRAFYDYDRPLRRVRSIKNVIDEMEYLTTHYDVKIISFIDDNFINKVDGKKRAVEIANEIDKRGLSIYFNISLRPDCVDEDTLKILKNVGLKHVSIGIESGNNKILERFNKSTTVSMNKESIKSLRSLDLSFDPFFIMFDPFISIEELNNNLLFLFENDLCFYKTITEALTIYRGTPIFYSLKQTVVREDWEYKYDFSNPYIFDIYNIINSLIELDKLDKILDCINYNFDINGIKNKIEADYIKNLELDVNKFIYGIMREVISIATTASEKEIISRVKNIRINSIKYIELFEKNLTLNGFGWAL